MHTGCSFQATHFAQQIPKADPISPDDEILHCILFPRLGRRFGSNLYLSQSNLLFDLCGSHFTPTHRYLRLVMRGPCLVRRILSQSIGPR